MDNVAQPLIYRGIAPAKRREHAARALQRVGLGDRMGHRPNEMSGGQRQRVAVARALVGHPEFLLADEPTGNLDSRTAGEILDLFKQLHAEGQTVVIVTHDPSVAARCRRLVRLHDGRIAEDRNV
jgi:putative ABC transport system ATP-binding protein